MMGQEKESAEAWNTNKCVFSTADPCVGDEDHRCRARAYSVSVDCLRVFADRTSTFVAEFHLLYDFIAFLLDQELLLGSFSGVAVASSGTPMRKPQYARLRTVAVLGAQAMKWQLAARKLLAFASVLGRASARGHACVHARVPGRGAPARPRARRGALEVPEPGLAAPADPGAGGRERRARRKRGQDIARENNCACS